MSRLAMLKQLAEKDPQDTFLAYAIAMEYVSSNDLDAAAESLEGLMKLAPDYPPAFHQAGRVYEQMERPEDARRCYTLGMASAERQGDPHAKAEMEMARAKLD